MKKIADLTKAFAAGKKGAAYLGVFSILDQTRLAMS
jgi:hypothetical protein